MTIAALLKGFAVAVFCSVLSFGNQVLAASTEWQDIGGGKARLVAVLSPETGQVTGGVEIKLNKGWKTYWRSPGDSGIPPILDFSASKSFSAGEILLPVPSLIKGLEVSYVGYEGQPIFRFDGQIRDTSGSGRMELSMLLGVCEEICIPAQASFELNVRDLFQSDPEAQAVINRANLTMPQEPNETFRIIDAKVHKDGTLIVNAIVPGSSKEPQLFVEGPQNWYFEPATLKTLKDGMAEFRVSLDGISEKSVLQGTELRFTISAGGSGIEEWRKVQQ